MATRITLDEGWDCRYESELTARVYRCTFALEPLDQCVRYRLHIETPGPTVVVLRGQVVTTGNAPSISADVTDYVTLDNNLLELRLQGDAGELFPDTAWLEAVPCEEAR